MEKYKIRRVFCFALLFCVLCTKPNMNVYANVNGNDIVSYARQFIGQVTYTWGGNASIYNTDCSGFICFVYQHFGVDLWGNRAGLVNSPYVTDIGTNLSEALPGDILVFDGHVALYSGNNNLIDVQADANEYRNYKQCAEIPVNYVTVVGYPILHILRVNTSTNQIPEGRLDSVSSTNDKIYVRGWALDPDEIAKSIEVHVYVGEPARQGRDADASAIANVERTDVNSSYPYHGYEFSFPTSLRGNQPVYVYALDTEGGHNPCIGEGTVNITGDVTKPVIASAQITSYDKDGYTITATASDNVGVASMRFPTWITGDSTDGIAWPEGTRVSNGTFTYRVNVSAFQNRGGNYCTDVYAYDAAGNESAYSRVQINIDRTPPNISSISIVPISESSYKASCQIADTNTLSLAKYGISVNGKPSIWRDATFTNGYYETIVNASDFSNECGEYLTTIRAIDSYGNESTAMSNTITLENVERPLTQITLNKETTTIQKGSTETLSVTYTPADTTDDKTVTWTSDDETVATVNSIGVVTAQSDGTTTITATVGNCSDSCIVTVEAEDTPISKPLTQIALSKDATTIQRGSTETLSITYTPADTTDDKIVTWTSDDETVATVNSNGVITAQSEGTATITATVGNCSDSCIVTVEAEDTPISKPLTQIALSKDATTIQRGSTETLRITYTPADTTDDKIVTWTSDDETVATVNSSGVITAQSEGIATITATVGNCSDTCVVTVEAASAGDNEDNTDDNDDDAEDNIPQQPSEEEKELEEEDENVEVYQPLHTHEFTWVTVRSATVHSEGLEELRCNCGKVQGSNVIPSSRVFVDEIYTDIVSAPQDGTISFDSARNYTFSDYIIGKLAERSDLSVKVTFEYMNEKYLMTIPAGVDYTNLLKDKHNFYGYFYFADIIGATIEKEQDNSTS